MAFKKSFGLFMVATALTTAPYIWAEEPKNEPPIPQLPAKEEPVAAPEKEEAKLTLVTYEEPSGFFSDNKYNQGPARYLSALDISGNFGSQIKYWRNPHLQTFVPRLKSGTSLMQPDLAFLRDDTNPDDDTSDKNPSQNQFSGTMRLRLDPTINVSETVRIKSTIHVFDNMAWGSTPSYLNNPSFMSMSQNSLNSWSSTINVRRAWAEASFAIGDLRFGRMPFHWGLGILHNSGDEINSTYGDQVDGIFFTTRIGDLFITPGYSIAYSGPMGRGAGIFSTDGQKNTNFLPTEPGARYPLTGDLTHVLSLSLLKRDSEFITNKKTEEGRAIFNYGALASYRRQYYDTPGAKPEDDRDALALKIVKRDSHVGLMSLWTELIYDTFHLEIEAAGIWGKYQVGEKSTDPLAFGTGKRDIWMLRGGIALESRYGFLNDRLQVGLNGGFASYQEGLGFGINDDSKNKKNTGYHTNFQFNRAYNVDLLLHREVLGGISGTAYFKPHISYFFSRNFGIRGDLITAIAPNASNTPGGSSWLGTEFDANAFLRTETGFYFQLAYGMLIPMKGLNNSRAELTESEKSRFGTARLAQTIQAFFGVSF